MCDSVRLLFFFFFFSHGTQQEFPNLNHVARGLGLGETPLEGVGRTLR